MPHLVRLSVTTDEKAWRVPNVKTEHRVDLAVLKCPEGHPHLVAIAWWLMLVHLVVVAGQVRVQADRVTLI